MALKKSQFCGSLWSSCAELGGDMDASQYKGYVLMSPLAKQIKQGIMQQLVTGRVRMVELEPRTEAGG